MHKISNLIFIISIFYVVNLKADVSRTVKTNVDWAAGQLVNGDISSRQGQLSILSAASVLGDEFETASLKSFWQTYNASSISMVTPEKLRFLFGAGTINGHSGIFSVGFTSPSDLSFESMVDTQCPGCNAGAIFINGSSPSLTLAITATGVLTQWTNAVPTLLGNIGIGPYYLRISKTGNLVAGYYKKAPTDSWILVSSLTTTATSSSIEIGMGNGGGATSNGTAEYEYFRLSPFAAQATWTSFAKDLSGTPTTQGTISWLQDSPAGTSISLQTATSNDGINWSPWSSPCPDSFGSVITSPQRRYIRIAATLTSDASHLVTPVLRQIDIKYPDATPQAPILSSPSHALGKWSNNSSLNLQWSMPAGNPAPESNYTYWVYANSTLTETATVALPQSSVGTLHSRTVALAAEGAYQINLQVQADQFSGSLTATALPYTFSFDQTPPGATTITSPTHPELLFTNNNSPVFGLQAVDAMSGVSGYAVSLDKLGYGDPGSVINVWGNEERFTNVENGTYYLHARAIDAAGNTGAVSHYGIRIDFSGALLSDTYVKVLPNPVRLDTAKVEYQLAASASEVTLEFMNGLGELVLRADGSKTIGKNHYLWDVSNVANGVYLYRIRAKSTEDGKFYSVTKKIAIIR